MVHFSEFYWILTRIPICISRHNCSGHSNLSLAEEWTKIFVKFIILFIRNVQKYWAQIQWNAFIYAFQPDSHQTAKFALLFVEVGWMTIWLTMSTESVKEKKKTTRHSLFNMLCSLYAICLRICLSRRLIASFKNRLTFSWDQNTILSEINSSRQSKSQCLFCVFDFLYILFLLFACRCEIVKRLHNLMKIRYNGFRKYCRVNNVIL